MVSALYQQYLISILRCLMAEDPQQQQPQPAPSNINLAVAITKYMHANYHKNISIQDISDTFYISPRHVNRVFEDYFGQSFKRTLNIYRLNYAKNYLLDTDFSTEKISCLVGLSSPKMLYQLFKEIEGMTISEFRAQHPGRRTFPSAGEPDAYKASDALSWNDKNRGTIAWRLFALPDTWEFLQKIKVTCTQSLCQLLTEKSGGKIPQRNDEPAMKNISCRRNRWNFERIWNPVWERIKSSELLLG